MSTRLHIVVPDELVERIDAVTGDVPRSAWIRRALESALSSLESLGDKGLDRPLVATPSAPARAPEWNKDPRSLAMQRQQRLNKSKT